MTPRFLFSALPALLLLAAVPQLAAQEADPVKRVENDADRWIELETRMAKERSQWKAEKRILQSRIDLLEAENESLESIREANQTLAATLLENRDRIARSIAENEAGLEALKEPLDGFAARLESLAEALPDPLREGARASLAKLAPKEDSESPPSVSTRVQTLLSTLAKIDAFNNSLTLASATRPDPSGGEVNVRVLYWGLASGYALDRANRRAWIVAPEGGQGWTWTEADDAYEPIAEAFEVYESETRDPRLVSLPIELK